MKESAQLMDAQDHTMQKTYAKHTMKKQDETKPRRTTNEYNEFYKKQDNRL